MCRNSNSAWRSAAPRPSSLMEHVQSNSRFAAQTQEVQQQMVKSEDTEPVLVFRVLHLLRVVRSSAQ